MSTEFDCLIVGGGPAGAIAAHSLARHGLKVLICDSGKRPARRIGESLPGSARTLLSDLDLLHVLEGHSHAFGNLSAWGSSEIVCTDFLMSPHGHGWHLDRVKFDRDLLNAAVESGAELRIGDVSAVDTRAKWLIDCSGRRNFISRHLGIERTEDDDLTAVYGWFRANDSDQRTLIESASEGWWYTSLVAENERVAAFHTSRAKAEAIFRNPLGWQAQLSQTNHISKLIFRSEQQQLHLAAANGGMLKQTTGPGWLAAGDAAMTFDPLSSQGLFNAIYTGRAAAEVVMGKSSSEDYEARLKSIREKYLQHQAYYYGQLARMNG